ncbi:hypothetical protein BH09ACT1_BH09ACT1_13760 [soil metagenome]
MTTIDHESATIASRYGRTPQRRRRDRRVYLIGAIVAAVVIVAWVVWAGLDQAGASIDSEDTGHSVINDHEMRIGWQVSMAVGSTASCALQVQNENHGVAGWKIVKIPPQKKYTTSHQTTVRNVEPAVTGLLYSCWLT